MAKLLIAVAVAVVTCGACAQRVPQPANAAPGMPQVTWVLMHGDRDSPDREFVCQSDPPGECVMPASRPGEEVYSDAHFYYHGTGADTTYTGSILIGPLESSGAPYRMQVMTTVKKDEGIINHSVAARVTSRPGTYDVVFDITARRSGSNGPRAIQFHFRYACNSPASASDVTHTSLTGITPRTDLLRHLLP
jgi:hypothetical protein